MKARYLPLSLALLLLFMAGCSDAVVEPEADLHDLANSKLRHETLMEQAVNPVMRGKTGASYHLVVGYGDDIRLDEAGVTRRVMGKYDGKVKQVFKKTFNGIAIEIGKAKLPLFLKSIAGNDSIDWVEPDLWVKPPSYDLTASGQYEKYQQMLSWNVARIGGAMQAEQTGDGDVFAEARRVDGVDVFVFDSGIRHKDLNVVEAVDFTYLSDDKPENDDQAWAYAGDHDPSGHGTHVAGVVGAQDNQREVVGVAPGVRLHDYVIIGAGGFTTLSTTLAAVEYVTAQKLAYPDRPMVVNMSLGADVGTTQWNSLDEAVQRSIEAGVVYVISSGNEGIDASTISPAHVEDAITVGAYDLNDRFADFSNYGPIVDLLAPGEQVLSLAKTGRDGDEKQKNLAYPRSGTSMAAPHVTGAVALYLMQHPDATPAEVRAALVDASVPFVQGVPEGTTDRSVYLDTPQP